jgi:hypothetical protein
MAKYYVQCGPIQVIINADSVDSAAFAALDKSLQSHVWIYDDKQLTEQDCRDHLMLEALMHLDPAIRISEQGFDRDDAAYVGTPETVDAWHGLMIGMKKLFVTAGLSPRTMSDVAGTGGSRSYRTTGRRPR